MQPPDQAPVTESAASEASAMSPPLLLSAQAAAAMCGKSLRTWRTWDAAGLVPKPIRIGRSTLWRADELRAWIIAGCPRRQKWQIRGGI